MSVKKTLLCFICIFAVFLTAGCTSGGKQVIFLYSYEGKRTVLEDQSGLISAPEVPEQDGYDFGGWAYAWEDGEAKLWDFEHDEVRRDTVLTAVWTAKSVTLFLDADGGDGCPDSVQAVFGRETVMPEPRKTGYWFLGWMIADYPDSVFKITNAEYDHDYYLKAAWLPFDPDKTIRFGKTEQDGSADNGPEPIEWLILDITDEKYILLSRDVIHAMTYGALNENSSDTYVNSAIRDWLNHEFYDSAFSDAEKNAILPIKIDDLGITDKVTLLSISERRKYLTQWRSRQCIPAASKAAELAGLRLDNKNGVEKYCWWWLRQEKSDAASGQYLSAAIAVAISNSWKSMYGIRPMITVDREALSGR